MNSVGLANLMKYFAFVWHALVSGKCCCVSLNMIWVARTVFEYHTILLPGFATSMRSKCRDIYLYYRILWSCGAIRSNNCIIITLWVYTNRLNYQNVIKWVSNIKRYPCHYIAIPSYADYSNLYNWICAVWWGLANLPSICVWNFTCGFPNRV